MDERLYTIRPDQGYFEAGLARGKQVLLGNTVHQIVAHWFDLEGRFLGLERFPMRVDPPTFPGTKIYETGSEYQRAVHSEMAAVKDQLGFQPAEIRARAFESEEACVFELPGEYERFLEMPESAGPEEREQLMQWIAEWRAEGKFVLDWGVDYWLSRDGRVLAHG